MKVCARLSIVFMFALVGSSGSIVTLASPYSSVQSLLSDFESMTDLQRSRWQENNEWEHFVSGRCRVSEIRETGWLSAIRSPEADFVVDCRISSSKHVALYYDKSYENEMYALSKDEIIDFRGKLKTIEHRGFWNTAYVLAKGKDSGSDDVSASEEQAPQFTDYPADEIYLGKPAQVVVDSNFVDMFYSRLSGASAQPPNFAGEYVLTAWGCGTSCLYGAVVNRKTGKVFQLPGSICCWKGEGERLIVRDDSRLLIMAGLVNESGEHGAHFYEFEDGEFNYVKSIAVPVEE